MGKKVSKRLLSLFLSVLMLATSLPFAGLSASAADESSNLPMSTSGAYLLRILEMTPSPPTVRTFFTLYLRMAIITSP